MPAASPIASTNALDTASLDRAQLLVMVETLTRQVSALQHQLDWFKRQMFGNKSERILPLDPQQLHLSATLPVPDVAPALPAKAVSAHTRTPTRGDFSQTGEALPFFDESRVPIVEIGLSTPEIEALRPDQYEVISEKLTYRLAQQPASYTVLRYRLPVIKRLDTGAILSVPAPLGVIEGSRADVSLCAGLLVDKFVYHLPLYRQHQRMCDCGVRVSRPWLTQLAQQISALLEPIYTAQLASIVDGRVIAMDETPIKAGKQGSGQMKTGYFWPVYGEHDEVCFPFSTSRAHPMVANTLGLTRRPDTVLLSDGYAAYQRYAQHTGVTHAQCWAHARREFFEAQATDPGGGNEALQQIGALYRIEVTVR